MEFGLSFFTSTGDELGGSRYGLLEECAKFADRNEFTALWTPERHFHRFGGIFPNPALVGAWLASITSTVQIRAGSVVLPLHNPVRVAEDWSVVDNLSQGRAAVSFATGWHPTDFVLEPERYSDRIERMYAGIEVVRRLWQGEEFVGPNGLGERTAVRIHPRPVQRELPMWMTCTRAKEVFVESGTRGFNVFTGLIFLTLEQVTEHIAEYRSARARAGRDAGKVTLTLHTYVSADGEDTYRTVHEPLKDYLRASVDLWRQENKALERLKQRDDALEFAVQRYFKTSGLFGPVEACVERVEELRAAGVDEIACLIDFGVAPANLRAGLERLAQVRSHCGG